MRYKNLGILIGLWMFSTMLIAASSNDQVARLVLNHVSLIQHQEADGDELYFDVSVFRSKEPTQYLRVPAKPFHWKSQRIQDVSNMTLWSDMIKKGEDVTIIVSLMETDMTALYPDELIGSVRVKFKNENGVLHTRWSMPNHVGEVAFKGKKESVQKFDLVNDGAHYKVDLSVVKP